MRKLTLLTVLLLVLGLTAGFADTIVEPSVSGSATLTFGVDLDTSDMGFTNAASSSVSIVVVDKASKSKGAEEKVYGMIELANYEIKLASADTVTATAPAVTAKIMAAPIWIGLYSAPTIGAADKVAMVDSADTATSVSFTTSGGLKIGYDSDAIDITLGLASEADWTADGDGWAIDLDLGVSAAPLTASAGVAMGFAGGFDGSDIGLGAKVDLALDLGEAMDLKPFVAFDGISAAAGFAYELGGGLTLELDAADKATIAVSFAYSEAADADLKVAFSEASGDDGLVAGIGATVTAVITNLTATMGYDIDVTADYTTPKVKPYMAAGYTDAGVVNLKVGAELKVITNVTIDAKYESADLTSGTDNGTITVATKVSY